MRGRSLYNLGIIRLASRCCIFYAICMFPRRVVVWRTPLVSGQLLMW